MPLQNVADDAGGAAWARPMKLDDAGSSGWVACRKAWVGMVGKHILYYFSVFCSVLGGLLQQGGACHYLGGVAYFLIILEPKVLVMLACLVVHLPNSSPKCW